jgi:hypothetical protein
MMRANFANSKRNPKTLVREPRAAPSAIEKAERLKLREQEARIAWDEYCRKQQAIDENMARLRAMRLEREAKAAG